MMMSTRLTLVFITVLLAACGERDWHNSPVSSDVENVLRAHAVWLAQRDSITSNGISTPESVSQLKTLESDPRRAQLNDAQLGQTDLRNRDLRFANLSGANIWLSELQGADLSQADLGGAQLHHSNLKGAKILDANLTNTNFSRAILTNSRIDIDVDQKLRWQDWLFTEDLPTVKIWITAVAPFTVLREDLKRNGFIHDARAITAMLRRNETQQMSWLEGTFQYVAFDVPVAYGYAPGRSLALVLLGIVLFAVPYAKVLIRPGSQSGRGGIWQVWNADRVVVDATLHTATPRLDAPVRLSLSGSSAMRYALYFSLLSACRIGWRDLNAGNWISRIQPNEYELRGTGWVRAVSGIQSLLSVYLIALCVLSYFGSPFE